MKTKIIFAGLALSTMMYACNSKPSVSSQNDTTQIAKEPIDSTLLNASNTNAFAVKAAIGGMMEVETSAKMIKYTENPDIQTLATMMVKDHGAANAALKVIAKKEKLQLPQALPAAKLEEIGKLEGLQEEEQNRAYANLMVKEHEEAVALFASASQNEANVALKAFAQQNLTTLKAHLEHAKSVQKMIESIKNDKGDQPLKTARERNP